ncbi:MAG: hypothetical protein SGCHY_003734 [Lobulomycetales sp.]
MDDPPIQHLERENDSDRYLRKQISRLDRLDMKIDRILRAVATTTTSSASTSHFGPPPPPPPPLDKENARPPPPAMSGKLMEELVKGKTLKKTNLLYVSTPPSPLRTPNGRNLRIDLLKRNAANNRDFGLARQLKEKFQSVHDDPFEK